MIYISHRGNLSSINPSLENSPKYIEDALQQNYYVEIDLWMQNNKLFLGHDLPQYEIDKAFLNNKYFFVHCKNDEALNIMSNEILDCEYFWHQEDKYTLTSKNKIWVHPSAKLLKNSICVLPEISRNEDLSLCYGICSDYITRYRND
jgi:hypothetical protein